MHVVEEKSLVKIEENEMSTAEMRNYKVRGEQRLSDWFLITMQSIFEGLISVAFLQYIPLS